jgi:hypothetical protein
MVQSRTNLWENTMELPVEEQKASEIFATEQQTSNELVRLVRKLRWIGMDEEAQRLEKELARRHDAATHGVVGPSAETD